MYEYAAIVLKVVDGDTIHVEVDLGLDESRKLVLRLAGINAPELATPAGPPARAHLQSLLASSAPLTIRTVKDKQEKYGRYLAWLYVDADPVSLNQKMINDGFAVAYGP